MLKAFKLISIIEGLSLIALAIAWVAKYHFDNATAMPYVGMTHGILWMIYMVASLACSQQAQWPLWKWLFSVVMSVTPLGFIPLDLMINKQIKADVLANTHGE